MDVESNLLCHIGSRLNLSGQYLYEIASFYRSLLTSRHIQSNRTNSCQNNAKYCLTTPPPPDGAGSWRSDMPRVRSDHRLILGTSVQLSPELLSDQTTLDTAAEWQDSAQTARCLINEMPRRKNAGVITLLFALLLTKWDNTCRFIDMAMVQPLDSR